MNNATNNKNILFGQLAALVQIFTSLAAFAILAHSLPQESVGEFSFVTNIVGLVCSLSGTYSIILIGIRDATQGKSSCFVISNVVFLASLINAIAFILLPFVVYTQFDSSRDSILLASALALSASVPVAFSIELARKEQVDALAKLEMVGFLIRFVLLSAGSILHWPFHFLVVASIAGDLSSGVFLVYFAWGHKLFSFADLSFKYSIQVLIDALPIALFCMTTALICRMGVIMIEPMMGAEAVAQYSAADGIIGYLSYFAHVTVFALYPAFCRAGNEDRERLKVLYKHILRICFIRVMPFAVVICIFPEWILSVLYGSQYRDAGTTLAALVGGAIFGWINGPASQLLTALKKQSIYLWGMLLALTVSFFLNLLLIPSIGIVGAAVAYMCAVFCSCIFNLYFIYREIHFLPYIAENNRYSASGAGDCVR